MLSKFQTHHVIIPIPKFNTKTNYLPQIDFLLTLYRKRTKMVNESKRNQKNAEKRLEEALLQVSNSFNDVVIAPTSFVK